MSTITKPKVCNCLKEVEQRTLKLIQDELSEKMNISRFDDSYDSGFQQEAIMFSGPMSTRLFIDVHQKYWFVKKNGMESSQKTFKTKVFLSFCPFCGKKYPEK